MFHRSNTSISRGREVRSSHENAKKGDNVRLVETLGAMRLAERDLWGMMAWYDQCCIGFLHHLTRLIVKNIE